MDLILFGLYLYINAIYLLYSIYFSGQLWTEESMNEWCPNSQRSKDVTSQRECQRNCEAKSACVGISYSHKDEANRRHCYMCRDDVLMNAPNNFGFYRRPGKKKLSVDSRVDSFAHLIIISDAPIFSLLF